MAESDRIRRPEERVVQVAAPAGLPAEAQGAEAGRPSIAVLPFANMSGDAEQEYFADGMVEEIITGLSRIRWLDVIARNSSFVYKGKAVDIREVGRTLGVRYVLEGSVRKGGDKLRITGQLIEAESGRHLWADKFDGALADVFELQDTITAAVVGAIEPNLRKAEIERVKRKRPENLDAYDLYLRALAYVYERDHQKALEPLDRALALAPEYVEAHGLAARCHSLMLVTGGAGEPAREAALRHARTVQTLGSGDAATLACAATALHAAGEGQAALGMIERAVAENPSSAMAHSYGSVIHASRGDAHAALAWGERALRLSPFDPLRSMAWLGICSARRSQEDFEGALAAARQALQINARVVPGHFHSISCLVRLGRMDEAKGATKQLLDIFPNFRISHVRTRTADHEQLLADLRAAGLPE